MNYAKWYYKSFKVSSFLKNYFAFFGVESAIFTVGSFFYKDFVSSHQSFIVVIVFIVPLIYAFAKSIPKRSILYKLANKDITIEVRIGDILKNNSSFVIPIDTRFEVGLREDNNLKNNKSVLASVVNRYFEGNVILLQEQIDLKKQKNKSNNIGDIIKIFYAGQKFYFLANTYKELNSDKVKQNDNTLNNALYGLWNNLGKFAENEIISIPLLNTGYAGNHNTKIDVIKNIIQSFIYSIKSGNVYCSHLIISVHNKDFYNHIINDFEKIEVYLKYICEFSNDIELKSIVSVEPNIRVL